MFLIVSMLTLMSDFKDSELAWRESREAQYRSEDSWLNLVGLFWLQEGANTFGSAADNQIVLPVHATVPHAGAFILEDGKVRFEMNRGQNARLNGNTQTEGVLEPESKTSILAHNNLRMFVIARGEKMGLRVRDLRAKAVSDFKGMHFYKPRKRYLVEATLERYEEPETLYVSTVADTEAEFIVPGILKFELKGKQYSLIPTMSTLEDEEYFIMFKDKTSGITTYGAGRYMYVEKADENGKVSINFNRAYNPPCAYTPFATCPLPPSENWLSVEIEAGEKLYDPETLLEKKE